MIKQSLLDAQLKGIKPTAELVEKAKVIAELQMAATQKDTAIKQLKKEVATLKQQ